MDLTERNKVEFNVPQFQKELTEYIRSAGENIRKRHSRTRVGKVKHSRKDAKPVLEEYDYCYHTGIRFIDAEVEFPNPNDPRKRSLDHIKPLVVCFIEGLSMDEANHPDNLCWCLKCVNNVRSCTDIQSFKIIADYYRNQFIKEGYDYR
jgi:hypothetical protein